MDFDPTKIIDDISVSGQTAIKTSHFDPLKIVSDEPIKPMPELKAAKEDKRLFIPTQEGYNIAPLERLKDYLTKESPIEGVAKAQNIYAISNLTKLSMRDVTDHYDELRYMSQATGLKHEMTDWEFVNGLVDVGLLAAGGELGMLMSAGEWAKAGEMSWKAFKMLGTYTVLDKVFPVEKYFSSDTSDTVKTWGRLADMTAKGILSGGLAETTPRFGELKNMFFSKKLSIPQTVNLTPEQIVDIGKRENSKDIFTVLGIEDRHIDASKTSNQHISISADKIMDLAQEPYWDKVKGIFGVKPEDKSYVINRPFEFSFGKDEKATAEKLRQERAGLANEQIARGNQLADRVKKLIPDEKERQGMFWYKAARGNRELLTEMLSVPEMEIYYDQIKSALNLSPKALQGLDMVEKYYQEAGKVSQEIGTIKNLTENYQNRIYKPEPPEDFIKSEGKTGLKQTTRHAKRRVFDTEFEAVLYGKEFATTDIADALAIHNEEMANINTNRKMADVMAEKGVGAWKKEQPEDWAQIGRMSKRVPLKDKEGNALIGDDGNQIYSESKFYAPKGIAKGLEAITDPNYVKKIDTLRSLQRYQGLIKTVDLSYSFFHHLSMTAVDLYQGGIKAFMGLPQMSKHMNTSVFEELETDFIRHTGMTSKVDYTQDIMRNLVEKNPDIFSKITNLPVIKQYLKQADKNAEFLFGRMQRYLKVMDYGQKISNWVIDNPTATNAQVKAAKLGYAREINAAYGGLNWEAMGISKSHLSLLRLGMLAPDWTISNVDLARLMFTKGTAGEAARSHIMTALVGGMVLTEGINKILTGHFTNENPRGHELEIQIAPNVYVSLLRGGIGDITKLASMINESGGAGAIRFAQGKLSPFMRTGVGLLAAPMGALDYTGHRIIRRDAGVFTGTYDILKYLLAGVGPVPFSLGTLPKYLGEKGTQKTVAGTIAVGTGTGRYSKPPKTQRKTPPTARADLDRLFKEIFKSND